MALFSFYSDFGVRHIQAPNPEIHLLGFDHCNQTLHDDVFQDDQNSRIKSLGTRREDCDVAWVNCHRSARRAQRRRSFLYVLRWLTVNIDDTERNR